MFVADSFQDALLQKLLHANYLTEQERLVEDCQLFIFFEIFFLLPMNFNLMRRQEEMHESLYAFSSSCKVLLTKNS